MIRLFISFSLISLGVYCELKFVDIFSSIQNGKITDEKLYNLVAATCAPIIYVFYYFWSFYNSIKVCNDTLLMVTKDEDFHNSINSISKQLIEDFQICHEQFYFPIQLIFYRVSIIFFLFSKALIILFQEIGGFIFLLILLGIIIIYILRLFIIKIANEFSFFQTERLKIIDEIIKKPIKANPNNNGLKRILKLNFKVFFRKLLVNFVGALSKPFVDFILMILILVFAIKNEGNLFNSTLLISLLLIGYRSIGPFITVVNGLNQIQFGLKSLSKTWKNATLKKIWRTL